MLLMVFIIVVFNVVSVVNTLDVINVREKRKRDVKMRFLSKKRL